MSDEGFLLRWSRRKHARASGLSSDPSQTDPPAMPVPQAVPAAEAVAPRPNAQDLHPAGESLLDPQTGSAAPPALDAGVSGPVEALPDIETLTPESDFRPFMRAGVTADQRNAALRRLFSDPHFNVMDGLDIYIDDYSRPDPLPAALLSTMTQWQSLDRVQAAMHAMASPSAIQGVVPDSASQPADNDLEPPKDPA